MDRATGRSILAVLAVVILAGAYFPRAIDDAFISAAYAMSLAEGGGLAWQGDATEGYSNTLWVLLEASAHLAGLDVILFAKCAALVGGGGLMLFASHALPQSRSGDVVVLALALWTPMAFWSAMALETTAFAACVTLGYVGLVDGDERQVGWLVAAALLRPEGVAWCLLGAAVWWWSPLRRGRGARWLIAALVVLAFHVWRYATFGALLPNAAVLKARFGIFGVAQLVAELISAAGILAACALSFRLRRPWTTLAPLGLAAATLLAINGDWMGPGRMLLAGVAATALVWARLGEPRPPSLGLLAPMLVLASAVQTRFLELPTARALLPRYGDPLDVPLRDTLAWLVRHVPRGGTVYAADIGILGHVPAMQVVDSRGLVSSHMLQARQHRDWQAVREQLRTAPPDAIVVAKYVPRWLDEDAPFEGLDPWWRALDDELAGYPHRSVLRGEELGWKAIVTMHHRHLEPVPLAVQHARWAGLRARFPAHRFVEAGR